MCTKLTDNYNGEDVVDDKRLKILSSERSKSQSQAGKNVANDASNAIQHQHPRKSPVKRGFV